MKKLTMLPVLALIVLASAQVPVHPSSSVLTYTPDVIATYSKSCARCHGEDGRAQTKKGQQLRATDFTSAKWQRGISDTKGIRIIANGHEEMPAFKDTLSADEIRELMTYVRKFNKG